MTACYLMETAVVDDRRFVVELSGLRIDDGVLLVVFKVATVDRLDALAE
jgi:hypothetical protein